MALGVLGLVHANKNAKKGKQAALVMEEIDSEMSRRGFRVGSISLKRKAKSYIKALAGCISHQGMEDAGVEFVGDIFK